MKTLAYYNGQYDEISELKVPFNDRVCFFGDGIYEATGFYQGKIFHLDAHIDRFWRSATAVKIELPYTKDELKSLLYEMVAKVEGSPLMVYWQQTRGTAARDHVFPVGVKSNLWIMIKPSKFPDLSKRIALTECEDTRFLHCNIKTLNLLPNVMAAQKAEIEGCTECVFHRGEIVTECAHSNVSILKDGTFITHPNDCYILPGIAKARLLAACQALNIPVAERPFTLTELREADEIIVSSSTKFCLVADKFCGQKVGGRDAETVRKLQEWTQAELY